MQGLLQVIELLYINIFKDVGVCVWDGYLSVQQMLTFLNSRCPPQACYTSPPPHLTLTHYIDSFSQVFP